MAASIVDASNLCVFVRAADLGVTGTELPGDLRARGDLMARLESIRAAAAVAAGKAATAEEATARSQASPKIALVAPAADAPTLSGSISRDECDIQVRMLSMGVPHLAVPLTGAMCVAVAARVPGTLVEECARRVAEGEPLRVGHGSGALPAWAEVRQDADGPFAGRASVIRTARVLMEGRVFAPVAAGSVERLRAAG